MLHIYKNRQNNNNNNNNNITTIIPGLVHDSEVSPPGCLAVMSPCCVLSVCSAVCCLSTGLSVLLLLLRRQRRKQQEGLQVDTKELELPETVAQKVLYYSEGGAEGVRPHVPLRPHPRRKDRRLRREEVRASIRMSLRESHLIGPEDEVFRQFILDRLAEADGDPYAPPFDCVRSYAYEGAGSPAGSLSSLDSCDFDPTVGGSRVQAVRLSPWCGLVEEDTF